jgi:hypothetical protein
MKYREKDRTGRGCIQNRNVRLSFQVGPLHPSHVHRHFETQQGFAVSVGRDTTFETDADDEEQILNVLDELADEVHEDVIANGFKFKTITIRVRFQDFDTHTRAKSLLFPTNDLDILKNTAKRLIVPFLRGNKKIRLIGVRVSNLISLSKSTLFSNHRIEYSVEGNPKKCTFPPCILIIDELWTFYGILLIYSSGFFHQIASASSSLLFLLF